MFMATTVAPIVLTLELDSKSQLFFDALRQQHFPKGRSFLAVHLVLFHHLPGGNYDAIRAQMATAAAAEAPLPIAVTGVRFLGRGVAYTLENQRLRALHKRLQKQWHGELTPQDQQKLNPHITVQNKVDEAVARELHRELAEQFQLFDATGTGLQLWAYRGGPWEPLEMFPFLKSGQELQK
jgi:2'-5' RNA ligase